MRRETGDIKHQFRRALIAIINKLGSNGLIKINIAPVMRIKQFMNTPDGAELVFDHCSRSEEQFRQETEALSRLIDLSSCEASNRLDGVMTWIEWQGNILEAFINKMRSDYKEFPLRMDELNANSMRMKNTIHAKNSPELIRGFNMMLNELGLLDKYRVVPPPQRGHQA